MGGRRRVQACVKLNGEGEGGRENKKQRVSYTERIRGRKNERKKEKETKRIRDRENKR
jgi:hypothetical protein